MLRQSVLHIIDCIQVLGLSNWKQNVYELLAIRYMNINYNYTIFHVLTDKFI